jgi:hypothetical protein
MSTKEKIYSLIDEVNPDDLEIILKLLETFKLKKEIPNTETAEAMLEADRIAHDPNVKGYTNIADLMKALDSE